MRKLWIAAAVILAVAAGIWFGQGEHSLPLDSSLPQPATSDNVSPAERYIPPTAPDAAGNRPTPATSTDSLAARAASPAPPAPANDSTNLAPLTVLDNARVAIHNYNAQFGENPVGTNPEITAALTGKNPKLLNFIRPDSGLRVNDHGELIDAFGTPFFFHQLSGKEMEIRSAGPDKIMWTFDDLVMR